MDGYRETTGTTRLFVATESANSVFFTDMYTPLGSSPHSTFGKFRVMKGLSDKTDYGKGIRNISAHATSGHVIFSHENNFLANHPSSAVIKTIESDSLFWGIVKMITFLHSSRFIGKRTTLWDLRCKCQLIRTSLLPYFDI